MLLENEWWIVWGIVISACATHKGGMKLFETEEAGKRRVTPALNLGFDKEGKKRISPHRFKEIKEMLHYAFFDKVDENDPWYPLNSLVEAFNDNRRRWLVASLVIVLDESMSSFQPRTTKTSLLPHLSFIFRKPKPLGTEYKVAADGDSRLIGYLEIQKGATTMRSAPFFIDGIGATAACSVRCLLGMAHSGQATADRQQAQSQEKRHILIADSWFGRVRMVEAVKLLRQRKNEDTGEIEYHIDRTKGENPNGHEVIAAVKTNSAWFPKKEIESTMTDWPSGSHIVLTCTAPETNVELVAIGYKYNAQKALCFIMTKNAASTQPGARHYIARFPDAHGNICSRKVPRPEALSIYFAHSNAVDRANHLLFREQVRNRHHDACLNA